MSSAIEASQAARPIQFARELTCRLAKLSSTPFSCVKASPSANFTSAPLIDFRESSLVSGMVPVEDDAKALRTRDWISSEERGEEAIIPIEVEGLLR